MIKAETPYGENRTIQETIFMVTPNRSLNIFFTSTNSFPPLAIAKPTSIENVITPKIFPSAIAFSGLTKKLPKNCLVKRVRFIEA